MHVTKLRRASKLSCRRRRRRRHGRGGSNLTRTLNRCKTVAFCRGQLLDESNRQVAEQTTAVAATMLTMRRNNAGVAAQAVQCTAAMQCNAMCLAPTGDGWMNGCTGLVYAEVGGEVGCCGGMVRCDERTGGSCRGGRGYPGRWLASSTGHAFRAWGRALVLCLLPPACCLLSCVKAGEVSRLHCGAACLQRPLGVAAGRGWQLAAGARLAAGKPQFCFRAAGILPFIVVWVMSLC